MDDLKALSRGLISAFLEYYNYLFETKMKKSTFVINKKAMEEFLSDESLSSDSLMLLLKKKSELLEENMQKMNLPHERKESLDCLLELAAYILQHEKSENDVDWESVRVNVKKTLVNFYGLRNLPAGETVKNELNGKDFYLVSTVARDTLSVPQLSLFWQGYTKSSKKISFDPSIRVAQFSHVLKANIFLPLVGRDFDVDKRSEARVSLIKTGVDRVFNRHVGLSERPLIGENDQDGRIKNDKLAIRQDSGLTRFFLHPTTQYYVQGAWSYVAPVVNRFKPW